MIALLLDHLWQSSIFLVGVGLLTLAFSHNSANVRFWLWFAASAKFLVPFAILTAVGTYFLTPITPPLSTHPLMLMEPMAQPFSGPRPVLAMTNLAVAPAAPAITQLDLSFALLALWALGFLAISVRWIVRWWRLRLLLRDAVPSPLVAPIAVKFSASRLEPGLVGIFHPVILLPDAIEQQLSPAEMNTIVAHELCHWRRRDNLLAAFHMLVEALFWFFPLVWWLGARLNAERERACDESVLADGNDPKTYAEGILKVCRIYLQSPLACAAGVSGAGLKRRMDLIMENRFAVRLNVLKKSLLAISAAMVVATPLALGLMASPQSSAQAQTDASAPLSPEERAQKLAEQRRPRTLVPFDPNQFDRFVGFYQLGPNAFFTISRDGDHFFSRLTGQLNVEIYPESPAKFFATVVAAQISFDIDAQGNVTGLVLHQGGIEQPAKKVTEAAEKSAEAALEQRTKNNTPSPGTETALRQFIDSIQRGRPKYDALIPSVAANHRQMEYIDVHRFQSLGALKSLTFTNVSPQGMDADVAAALESGQISSTGQDSVVPDSPLWNAPHVIITPHVAAQNVDDQLGRGGEQIWAVARENLRRFVNGDKMLSVIDPLKGY